jgi:hypothetical protein
MEFFFHWWVLKTAIVKNGFHRIGQEALEISLWNHGGVVVPKILGTIVLDRILKPRF